MQFTALSAPRSPISLVEQGDGDQPPLRAVKEAAKASATGADGGEQQSEAHQGIERFVAFLKRQRHKGKRNAKNRRCLEVYQRVAAQELATDYRGQNLDKAA